MNYSTQPSKRRIRMLLKNMLEVSTVFMEYEGKLLLLHREPLKTWGVPGGKLENGETPLEGLIREIWEELHLKVDPKEILFIHSLNIRHYKLHCFRWLLKELPLITLNPKEYLDYRWQPITAFADMPLLEGQLEAFRSVYFT